MASGTVDSERRVAPRRPAPADSLRVPAAHGQLELAKWVAVITMTVDHYGKIVDPSFYFETNAIGRLTYPVFAWIIGTRLALNPSLGRQYLTNLISWALLTQPVYVFVGKSWSEPNIFFSLALGVGADRALRTTGGPARVCGLLLVAATGLLATYVDYGLVGVIMIPAVARLAAHQAGWGAWGVGLLGVLSNVMLSAPYFAPGGLWAALSCALAQASLRLNVTLPRLPKQAFYAYYPAHILLLHLVRLAR